MEKEKIIIIGNRKFRIFVEDENFSSEVYEKLFKNLERELIRYVGRHYKDKFEFEKFDEYLYRFEDFFRIYAYGRYTSLNNFNVKIFEIFSVKENYYKKICQKCLNEVKKLEKDFHNDLRVKYLESLRKRLEILQDFKDNKFFLVHNGYNFEIKDFDIIAFNGMILQDEGSCKDLLQTSGVKSNTALIIDNPFIMNGICKRSISAAIVGLYLDYYKNLSEEYFDKLDKIFSFFHMDTIFCEDCICVFIKNKKWCFEMQRSDIFGNLACNSKVIEFKEDNYCEVSE